MSNNIFRNSKTALKGGDYTPVKNSDSVKTIIESYAPFFVNFFNNKEKTEQAMTIALDVAMDDKYKNCSKHSIVKAIINTYRLGLNPTPGIDHTWLVSYNGYIKLIIGSKGFTSLLFKAGWLVEQFPVYKCDDFLHTISEKGQKVNLVQNWNKRNLQDKKWVYENLEKVYLIAKHVSGLTKTLVVDKSEIEKLRLCSPSQTYANPNYATPEKIKRVNAKLPVDIWEDWYEEMALAKSIKKMGKQLPLGDDQISSMIKFAINLDDYADINDEEGYQKAESSIKKYQNANNNKTVNEDKTDNQTCKRNTLNELKKGLNHLAIKILNEAEKGNRYFISINKFTNKKFQELLIVVEKLGLAYKVRENDIVIIVNKKDS